MGGVTAPVVGSLSCPTWTARVPNPMFVASFCFMSCCLFLWRRRVRRWLSGYGSSAVSTDGAKPRERGEVDGLLDVGGSQGDRIGVVVLPVLDRENDGGHDLADDGGVLELVSACSHGDVEAW